MRSRWFLSAAAFVATITAIAGAAASPAQAVPCIELGGGAKEVNLGTQFIGTSTKVTATIVNKCGKEIEIISAFFEGGSGAIEVEDSCKGKKLTTTIPSNACNIKYIFNPGGTSKYALLTELTYKGAEVPEDTLEYLAKGQGKLKLKWNAAGATASAGEATFETGVGISITCNTNGEGEVWNAEESAYGKYTSYGYEKCKTSKAGCSVTSATAEKLPWSVQAFETESAPTAEVGPTKSLFKLSSCFPLPSEVTIEGTVWGFFDNPSSCIEFSKAAGLTATGGVTVTLSGEDCFTKPSNLELE